MLAHLNDRQTVLVILAAIFAVTLVIVKIIDAFNKRGERFHERFIAYKGVDESEDSPDATPTHTAGQDPIPGLGITRRVPSEFD